MKIAFVTPEFVTEQSTFDGGLANYLLRVSLALIQLGHEPHVFVASDVDQVVDYQGIKTHKVRIDYADKLFSFRRWLSGHKLEQSLTWLHIGKTLNSALRKSNQQEKFDIVQYASYGAMGYYRLKELPAVIRLSSYEPLFRAARGESFVSKDASEVERREKEAMRRVDAVFGPSKLSADAVHRDLGINVQVIETPFTLDVRDPDTSLYDQKLKGKKYLLYWGTLSRLKGVEVILKVLPEILKANTDLHFVFVGKVDAGVAVGLETVKSQFPSQVIHFERLPHSQLYPIIQNAFGAVLPSLYDNLPNTCIEGMAFGRIVIGTRDASFDQLIIDGENGFLCNIGDSESLKQAIARLLSLSDQERSEMGKNAIARIEQLRPEQVVVQLVDFYTKTINSKT